MKTKKLSKKDLLKYKELLLEEKKKLWEEFFHIKNTALNKSQREASGDLSGYSYHMADMASDLYERDFLLRLASEEREKFYAMDDALKRVEDKSYGKCLTCSKPIKKKRLNAVPQTSHCLKCQTEEESKAR
jgi:RNA polymerase-binding transcription factor DksA